MSLGLIPLSRNRGWSLVRAGNADRLFDELWSDFGRFPSAFVTERARFVPRVDVTETDEAYTVTAELPGLEEKDFEVVLEDGVLTLKGQKRSEHESEEANVRRYESRSGEFVRRLRFETPIDENGVVAAYKNGVLTVTLPKPEEARPQVRNIPIQTS